MRTIRPLISIAQAPISGNSLTLPKAELLMPFRRSAGLIGVREDAHLLFRKSNIDFSLKMQLDQFRGKETFILAEIIRHDRKALRRHVNCHPRRTRRRMATWNGESQYHDCDAEPRGPRSVVSL